MLGCGLSHVEQVLDGNRASERSLEFGLTMSRSLKGSGYKGTISARRRAPVRSGCPPRRWRHMFLRESRDTRPFKVGELC
jgi:hypothetical protein